MLKTTLLEFQRIWLSRSVAKVPREICLAGRDPEYDHLISCDGDFIVRCGAGYTLVPSEYGKGFRAATIKDQKEFGIVADSLDSIDFSGLMSIQDVPPQVSRHPCDKNTSGKHEKAFYGPYHGFCKYAIPR